MKPSRPVLFMLHALGGSARAFNDLADALVNDFECVAIDLPGFGGASAAAGTDVASMADEVARIISGRAAPQWLLVGHSMGGKVASVVAARTLAGDFGLFGLQGVVLLAGSPPSPEPMDDDRRAKMIGWAAAGPLKKAAAHEFIDGNIGSPLPPDKDALAIADLLRTSREGWLAWLERGSREDWSPVVGELDVPCLVIVGSKDGDLGEQGQRATNLRVYPRGQLVEELGAGHLLPLERPQSVAETIRRFWRDSAGRAPAVPEPFARLIASDRVGRRTRAAFAKRILADSANYAPQVLSLQALTTLRALAARVVPQTEPVIDLAARFDAMLACGAGDGWRFADLPADREACALALNALAGFEGRTSSSQDEVLTTIADGQFEASTETLSAGQMQRWFEDLRGDLVRLWLAHPATLAHIGFDGFANGGDRLRKQGFALLAADELEAWQAIDWARA